MNRILRNLTIAAMLLGTGSLCFAQKYDGGLIDKTVAVVGNEMITLADIESQAQMMKAQGMYSDKNMRCEQLESMMTSKLFLMQARVDSLTVNNDMVDSQLSSRLDEVRTALGGDDKVAEYFGKPLYKLRQEWKTQLEEYRNSLLRFRYEQRYLNERLDTVITYSEIETYYNEHKDLFILDVPIVKARYLNIMKDSPNRERIIRKMSSEKYEDLVEADSLAYSSALRYFDYSDRWITAVTLAKEFGTDYATMLSGLRDGYIQMETENGDLRVAYICDLRRGGTLAPVEYCEDRIRDIILSTRKHALFTDLERDLLDDALDKQNFVIY